MELTIKELSFQATAYEGSGIIDYEDFAHGQILEAIDDYLDDNEILSLYGEYLQENYSDDMFYTNDEYFFEEMFSSPIEAVRATYFGKYNYMDDYVRFNGYGNLDTLSEYELVREAKENNDFIQWLYDNTQSIYNDDLKEVIEYLQSNEEEIKEEAMKLVRKGY